MFTYFIQGEQTQLIKIGQTRQDPEKRLAQLQTGSPDKLVLLKAVESEQGYEAHLHRLFQEHNSHGEWYYPVPKLIAFIDKEVDQPKGSGAKNKRQPSLQEAIDKADAYQAQSGETRWWQHYENNVRRHQIIQRE